MINNTRIYLSVILTYITLGILGLLFFKINWLVVLIFCIFFAVGNGTIGHRYFSHNSFEVGKITHWLMGLWVTLCAYSPVHYWIVQHKHHHRHTDDPEDVHAPRNGILNAFILWPLNVHRIERVFKERSSIVNLARALRDTSVVFYGRWFVAINILALLIVSIVDWEILFSGVGIAYLIEQTRLGIINTVTHTPGLPGNYRNHDTGDLSQNNWILGLLTLGFGWHNNHHADPRKLILTEHWWEIDIEGYIGWLLSRTASGKNNDILS